MAIDAMLCPAYHRAPSSFTRDRVTKSHCRAGRAAGSALQRGDIAAARGLSGVGQRRRIVAVKQSVNCGPAVASVAHGAIVPRPTGTQAESAPMVRMPSRSWMAANSLSRSGVSCVVEWVIGGLAIACAPRARRRRASSASSPRWCAHDQIVDPFDALAVDHGAIGAVRAHASWRCARKGRLDGAPDIVVADDAELVGWRFTAHSRSAGTGSDRDHHVGGGRASEQAAGPWSPHVVDAAAADDRVRAP